MRALTSHTGTQRGKNQPRGQGSSRRLLPLDPCGLEGREAQAQEGRPMTEAPPGPED